MNWKQHIRRSHLAVVGVMAVAATTLVLVPALAQVSAAAVPRPYVELMTDLVATNRYVRFVDDNDATSDPQQSFDSLNPFVLGTDPEILTVAASADPQTILGGSGCLNGLGAPISALPPVSAAHYTQPPISWIGALPLIGVKSYACASGPVPAIVADDDRATITPGEALEISRGADLPLDFSSLKLSVNTSNTSAVRVTGLRNGSVVGTQDIDIDVDCVNSTDWQNENVLCATRVVPYFGALQMRYLNVDFGEPFDSFELTATAGSVRLKGRHPSRFFLNGETFGGTIGGETGQTAISEPPAEDLPGYDASCTDAADPPAEGPCGGKEVNLSISRFLDDVDGDGQAEQVLNVVPAGAVAEVAYLTVIVTWAPEAVPAGPVPLSRVDEDGPGPDDDDPAAWCSVDPPGPPGDQWCLGTSTSASAGPGQIQVTETFYGTGDPRFTR